MPHFSKTRSETSTRSNDPAIIYKPLRSLASYPLDAGAFLVQQLMDKTKIQNIVRGVPGSTVQKPDRPAKTWPQPPFLHQYRRSNQAKTRQKRNERPTRYWGYERSCTRMCTTYCGSGPTCRGFPHDRRNMLWFLWSSLLAGAGSRCWSAGVAGSSAWCFSLACLWWPLRHRLLPTSRGYDQNVGPSK